MAETEAKTSATNSSSSNNGNEVGDFECNICLDVAQNPVITLCGHLYCWPCLHKWLCLHSHSHECPVCKALIQEEKVIPLYGRGKTPTDPRSKPVPGVEIPNRPAGQSPETAPSPVHSNLSDLVFGLMGGFMPVATASFGNFGMSVSLGGVFSPLFVSINGFPGIGGPPPVYPDSIPRNSRGMNGVTGQADDENLKKIFLIIFILVVIALFML